MALQGTLDTFELPDVLRLLASTRKSGRLHLKGDRGEGDVWMQEGLVVGVGADGAPSGPPALALFELLRAHEGAFAFEPGASPAEPHAPSEVEPMLAAAEEQLAEWRIIEQVVPSLDARVGLAPELEGPDITIDAATWRIVAQIGSGLSVRDLGRALDMPEVPVSRLVCEVVSLGIASVTVPTETSAWNDAIASTPATPAPSGSSLSSALGSFGDYGDAGDGFGSPEPAAPARDTSRFEDLPRFGETTPSATDDWPSVDGGTGWDTLSSRPAAPSYSFDAPAHDAPTPEPSFGSLGSTLPSNGAAAPGPRASLDQDEADEVARQLAMLSPRAAQAIAAAAAPGSSDDARLAAIEAVDEGEEPINRGLLLKFLSSVQS